ncbi:MAG: hypothetical protein COB67_10210 [SAR324 cluster bacterium]|uniref:Uncharacterized protein n=1 Tax=SAR324 cluster bacterium TaxID=2024889 RepID=A0A2A4SZ45_9DELT|nr:MAG: hypothetical protein COB67_10210 [SAR324 cluster bacterium]
MSNTCIVVETGVIQCEHGGIVKLISSEGVHVIGGLKPMHDIDLIGAVIDGCTYNISVGGQCTCVASITSAVTESNVGASSVKYLLRVDGCQTDKGAALVLVDPGQTNTVIPVKGGGSPNPISAKELETAQVDTKENIKQEKYRIYPLRKSGKNIRALRPARDFNLLKNYHHTLDLSYTHDKIVTYTQAYLYVKHNGETKEYKVVNRGDMLNPTIQSVQFKDTQTNVIRKHIPIYDDSGSVELVYSNLKLAKSEQSKFTPITVTLGSSNKHFQHHKEYSKNVKHTQKDLAKKSTTKEEITKQTRAYLSIVVDIDDPIGEVEDLYNEYESSYHRHYGMNKALIDDIRAKNQYPYAIADMIDYLYVSEKEREKFNSQRDKLQEQYKTLVTIMKEDMISHIESNMIGNNIVPAMEYRIANEYYEELKFLDRDFFNGNYSFSLDLSSGKHTCTTSRRAPNKRLLVSSTKHKELKNSPIKALAFLTFSVCYGEKYKDSLSPRLKEESEKFYYLLKNATPLPQMNENSLDEVAKEIKHQEDYKKICSGEDPLLDEFEQLDITIRKIAYDPKFAKDKLNPKNAYGFESLKTGNSTREIFYDKHLRTPKELAEALGKTLASSDLADVIKKYQEIKAFENEDEEHSYYNYLLNLSTMLIAPRAELDKETEELSVFNHKNEAIKDLLSFITKQLNSIGEEKANNLHNEPIKEHYLKSIYTLIAHAKIEKPNQNFPERKVKGKLKTLFMAPSFKDKGREDNATSFLKEFEQDIPKQSVQTNKLLDNNFAKDLKVKTDTEKLYTSLQQIDGVTFYLDKADGTVTQVKEKKGLGGSKDDINNQGYRNNSKYEKLLSSTKMLSFFITVAKMGEYIQGKEKLKIHNVIGFMGDTLSASHYIADLAKNSGNEIPKAKSLSKSLEHITKIDRVVSASSMKVIVRFGLVGVMANAVNDLSTIDPEKNEDYFIAVGVKNALYVALLFTPALFALGAIAITEVVWFFLKDKIENSKLELYLYDSLLFNAQNHNDGRWFNSIDSNKPYTANLLLETVKTQGGVYKVKTNGKTEDIQALKINGFTSMNQTREFIASNYEQNPSLMEHALKNEISRLKSVLYNIDITINDDKQTKIVTNNSYDIYHIYPYIDLPKKLGDNVKRFLVLINDVVVQNGRAFEVDENNVANFNILPSDNLTGVEQVANSDVNILVQTDDDICLKYKIIYDYSQTPYGQMKASANQPMIMLKNLKIKEIKSIALSEEDYQILGF